MDFYCGPAYLQRREIFYPSPLHRIRIYRKKQNEFSSKADITIAKRQKRVLERFYECV